MKRRFNSQDTGQMTYYVEYCCLLRYASKWTKSFQLESEPPTDLPSNMLQLNLTRTPTLKSLETESANGLTYFRATYTAGFETDIVITESSDIRSISWPITYPVGYEISVPFTIDGSTSFVTTGTETITASFDYVSISVTATTTNSSLDPQVTGSTGEIFNAVNTSGYNNVSQQILDTYSKSKNRLGEYTYSKTSTGIYVVS